VSDTRSRTDTMTGPGDCLAGDVYVGTVAASAGTSTFAAANVH
jgi:hypothetical protein